jgi:hypothetical protein
VHGERASQLQLQCKTLPDSDNFEPDHQANLVKLGPNAEIIMIWSITICHAKGELVYLTLPSVSQDVTPIANGAKAKLT